MPLSPDQLPLPRPVRDRVLEIFAAESPPRQGAQPLSHADISAFLAKSIDTDSSPLSTLRRRAAKVGRPADLAADDHATLVWISEAFGDWEESYPLESPLREHVRRLLPLAIAVALDDQSFFDVGAHPLHRLLDTLQEGSVGWQARLDRAGQMLEQRVERSVEKALEWFDNPGVNFRAITSELEGANDRDDARAQRMVQRLEETEAARLKTMQARRRAAVGINEGLQEFELPAAIGDFLKGAWFESAQLVILRHGENSHEWRDMLRATRNLMESVQPRQDLDDDAQEHRKQLLRRLPGELRRWMFSLEHDRDAIDAAIGLVEYSHLRLQHGQQLDMVIIGPLREGEDDESSMFAGERLETGQWYHFADGDLRAQLVLQMDNGNHLLFSNFVGLKAADLSQKAFRQQRKEGLIKLLPNRSTFSLSLAAAAGVYSDDTLRSLLDPGFQPPPAAAAENAGAPPSAGYEDSRGTAPGEPAYAGDGSASATPAQDAWQRSPADAAGAQAHAAPHQAPAAPHQQPAAPHQEPAAPHQQPAAPHQEPAAPHQEPAAPHREPAAPHQEPAAPYQEPPAPRPEPPAPHREPPPPPYREPPPPPYRQPATPDPQPAAPYREPAAPAPQPPPPAQPPPATPPEPAAAAEKKVELDIPMGSWLGFHDGETPMMAKLAVYDPRRDNYILVNRKGIAMRELSGAELVRLMHEGLVDILETRSHFRDEVQRAREEDR